MFSFGTGISLALVQNKGLKKCVQIYATKSFMVNTSTQLYPSPTKFTSYNQYEAIGVRCALRTRKLQQQGMPRPWEKGSEGHAPLRGSSRAQEGTPENSRTVKYMYTWHPDEKQ